MPEPGPGEVLVKMKAAGICFSDFMILTNKYKGRVPVPIPMIMGHEGAGVVADVGKGVQHVKAGDKVGLNPLWGCGQCENCFNGHPNMCMTWRHLGITCDGTFAEYRAVPAFIACKLPDSVSPVDAAFIEPISLAVRTFEHVKPMLGDTVAIIGPGSIGLFHLQAFKSAGAAKIMVIGLDKDAKRFEIAKKLGADHIINGSKEDVVKRVRELTNGLGADIVVETANHPSTVPLAVNLAAAQGPGPSLRPISRSDHEPPDPSPRRRDDGRGCGDEYALFPAGHALDRIQEGAGRAHGELPFRAGPGQGSLRRLFPGGCGQGALRDVVSEVSAVCEAAATFRRGQPSRKEEVS